MYSKAKQPSQTSHLSMPAPPSARRSPSRCRVLRCSSAAPVAAPVAPAACPEGYFVADWDAAKKARRAEMAKAAKARRAAAKKAAVA